MSKEETFRILSKNYGLQTPDQIQKRILFKLLSSLFMRTFNVDENDKSEAGKFIRTLKHHWRITEIKKVKRKKSI